MKKKNKKVTSKSLGLLTTKPKKEILYVRISEDALTSIDSLRGTNSRSLFVNFIFASFLPQLIEEEENG